MAILSEETINVEVVEDIIEVTIENICTSGSGSGDMTKIIYDSNNNGVVDSSESIILTIVANEDIPQFQMMTSTGYIADSNNLAHIDRVSGISIKAITNNTSGEVLAYGKITNINWNFTVGSILFLNGTAISQTPPTSGFICQIGKVINSNTILINIKDCIKL